MVKILIADDHSVIRDGVKAMLKDRSDFSIVAEVETGKQILEYLKLHEVDVLLTDISMPDMDGIEATNIATKKYAQLKVVCLSMHEQYDFIKKMTDAGAHGYIFKDCTKQELIKAIDTVLTGKKYFNPEIFNLLINAEQHKGDEILSDREKEILKLITEEFTNQEIAEKLHLSVRTVDTHRRNILQKLDVKNTAGLVKYAIKSGLIE